MSPSSETSDPKPLQNLLNDAENELRRRLEDACEAEAKGISTESTQEIRQLEDNLLAAAVAAKQTIAIRSQMNRQSPVDDVEKVVMGVREFTDDEGRPWRAWSVVPGHTKASAGGRQFLGDFQDGWICFEGLSTSARRRLPYPRAKWPGISEDEIRHLLQRAIDAPIRQKKVADAARMSQS